MLPGKRAAGWRCCEAGADILMMVCTFLLWAVQNGVFFHDKGFIATNFEMAKELSYEYSWEVHRFYCQCLLSICYTGSA